MKKKFKKIIAGILVAIMLLSSAPMSEIAKIDFGNIFGIEAEAANGKTREQAVEWARNQAYNPRDYDGCYGVQCVDLIIAYYLYLGAKSPLGNGCDFAWNGLPSGWTRIPKSNGFIPQPGDVAVWTYASSSYGHVAIVLSANSSTFTVAEFLGSKHTGRINTYNYSYGKFFGVVRPNFDNGPKVPGTPSISINASGNVATGTPVVVSWGATSDATGYKVYLNGNEVQNSSATSYSFKVDNASTYSVNVVAYNSKHTSGSSNTVSVTGKNPSTVTFLDWDGRVHNTQTVNYNSNAVTPESPSREGYTFTGWDKNYDHVTSNLTVNANYKINTYNIKFVGDNGQQIGSTQKVNYGSDATPPTVEPRTGYTFIGWSSEDYKNVKKNATISAIFEWENNNLPIVASITSARRQQDGYYVTFNLINSPNGVRRGRAVVSLKTENGKLVDTTESAAFSIPSDSTKNGMEVFIPCDYTATLAEVIIVDSYKSTVPLSMNVTSAIDQGTDWSDWSTTRPTDSSLAVEEKTQYRYRDKVTTTGNTKSMSGWTWDGTTNTSVGDWSGWQWGYIGAIENESQKREVATQSAIVSYNDQEQWRYSHYLSASKTNSNGAPYSNGHYHSTGWRTTRKVNRGAGSGGYTRYGDNYNYWGYCEACGKDYFPWYNEEYQCVHVSANYGTQYRYRDTNYSYGFWKWNDWSSWSDDQISSSSSKEVQTRTVYRSHANYAGIEGEAPARTISGTLDPSFAGKQITLFIYKVDEASDYSNEFVGQSVIGADGSYSFTVKLREEPSVKTGDYTIAIGIEGATNTMIIDTIEAPKPTHTIKFYNWDGSIIETKTVVEGESVVLPENPSQEGYTFVGWDNSLTNVKDDIDVYPIFIKKVYTVVYVDWIKRTVETRTFEHGDPVYCSIPESVYGYDFDGWNGSFDEIIATQNMILTAEYDAKEYNVKFYDFDGNVISDQNIDYGNSSDIPDDLQKDGYIFLGWEYEGDLQDVDRDIIAVPRYVFEETCAVPVASIEGGSYGEAQTVELSCATENSVIYYTTDGEDPKLGLATEYTGPITISETKQLRFIATHFGMNDSEECSEFYAINTDQMTSDWMEYSELPAYIFDVEGNVLERYGLIASVGYKYKNICSTSSLLGFEEFEENGWTLENESFGEWSDWSTEYPTVDDATLEVDEQISDTIQTVKYKYSRYRYIDSETGETVYSDVEADGEDCTLEERIFDERLGIMSVKDGVIKYGNSNVGEWFNQRNEIVFETPVYRYRIKTYSLYKWTDWTEDEPSSNETREYTSEIIYKYTGYRCHVVTVKSTTDEDNCTFFNNENETLNLNAFNSDVEGYTLSGVYTDETCTNEWNIETDTVTEDITLWTVYDVNQYTVVFKNSDGTVLSTQTVDYCSSATPPEVPVEEGYAFIKWDIEDYQCVTDDLVVNAIVVPESEVVKVRLSKTKFTMMVGSCVSLTATVTPDTLESTAVVWSSSDYGIADVDYNGYVTALSSGTVTITATAIDGTKADCVITVLGNPESFVTLKSPGRYTVDKGGFIRGVAITTDEDEGTNLAQTVAQAKNEFITQGLVFIDINGNVLDDDDLVGTGTRACIMDGDDIVNSVTFVVTGDTNGDGKINNMDVAVAMSYLVDKLNASAPQVVAFDVNGDGKVNNRDASMLARFLVGKETI